MRKKDQLNNLTRQLLKTEYWVETIERTFLKSTATSNFCTFIHNSFCSFQFILMRISPTHLQKFSVKIPFHIRWLKAILVRLRCCIYQRSFGGLNLRKMLLWLINYVRLNLTVFVLECSLLSQIKKENLILSC